MDTESSSAVCDKRRLFVIQVTLKHRCENKNTERRCISLCDLQVCMVSVSVLKIPVGKLRVLLAVWDATEGGVVIETAVKHLIHHSLSLLPAHLPHG